MDQIFHCEKTGFHTNALTYFKHIKQLESYTYWLGHLFFNRELQKLIFVKLISIRIIRILKANLDILWTSIT